MPTQLTLAPAAARDLDNVRLWLTQPGAGATAQASLIDISDAIETIADAPFQCPLSRDHPDTRARVVRRHTIVYETDPHPGPAPAYATLVRVLRVFRPGQSRDRL